jgi:hypothetical protein
MFSGNEFSLYSQREHLPLSLIWMMKLDARETTLPMFTHPSLFGDPQKGED